MSTVVNVPAISVNEPAVLLTKWLKANGDRVHKGEVICQLESTKATVEVEADADGYLTCLAAEGDHVTIGAPMAVLADTAGEDVSALLAGSRETAASGGEARWTKKAALVARRLGIDLEALAARHPGKVLGEADVLAAQQSGDDVRDLQDDRYPGNRMERILLLGGGAGAGALALDAIFRTRHQRAVGILDGNPATHGKTVMGVPVLGPLGLAEDLYRSGACDSVIILFTDNIEERAGVFEDLRSRGVPFANVVDPTVFLGLNVRMGQGNLIMANGYLATATTIGDNNFFASHVCIEHHSTIGSHCTFGPRCTTSGRVTVGDRVKLGMTVAIEPYLTIGERSVIASGAVITTHIPADSLVKAHVSQSIRPRQESRHV